MYTKHEVNILIEKKRKEAFKGRKKRKQELRTFQKMEVLGSEESDQSLNDSWSSGSNKGYLDNIQLSRMILKKNSKTFFTLDQCIYSNFNYEYLRCCLTSHTNKKLSKNKIKKKINQTDLVPITFGILISKQRNSEKVSPQQNGVSQKKNLRYRGASTLIIHKSYLNKNNFDIHSCRIG